MTPPQRSRRVWLFDLDNTLHNASHAAFKGVSVGMNRYIEERLGLSAEQATSLRQHYFERYGATLLGLTRHHGVDAAHFLHETHVLPELEAMAHGHPHDLAALRRLPGRKLLLTNAPLVYTRRVLAILGLTRFFEQVISVEQMHMFGALRPKPDARMLRRLLARLRLRAEHCVLVEDSLENLKSARRVGMATVWMQRWTRSATWGLAAAERVHKRPAYVDRRVLGLATLRRGGSSPRAA